MKRILEQKGFSLVEVLMVAGLAGGIGLVITQVMSNMNKGLKNTENLTDILTVTQSIQRVLATPDNCTATFIGKNPKNSSNVVNALRDKSSGVFMDNYKNIAADPNMKYGQGQIRIKSYSLSDSAPDVEVDTLLTTHFIIDFEKGKNAFGGKNLSKRIPLKVVLDGSGNIKTCIALTNASDNIWKYANNNIDIFFNGGNIGVGTTTPMAMVHIDDNSFFANSLLISTNSSSSTGSSPRLALVDTKLGTALTAPAWYIDNSSDRFRIFRQPNLTTAGQEHLTITNAGLVGLGTSSPLTKLHVVGPSGADAFIIKNLVGSSYLYSFSTSNTSATIGAWDHGSNASVPLQLNPSGSLEVGNRIFGLSIPGSDFFWLGLRGSGADGERVAIGIESNNSTTGLVKSIQFRTMNQTRIVIDPNGNMGVNTYNPQSRLDVAGDIKPGNEAQATGCSGANRGAIRYNSGADKMEYCSGSGWVAIGQSGGGTYVDLYKCPFNVCDNNSVSTCAGQISSINYCFCRFSHIPSSPTDCPYFGRVLVQ